MLLVIRFPGLLPNYACSQSDDIFLSTHPSKAVHLEVQRKMHYQLVEQGIVLLGLHLNNKHRADLWGTCQWAATACSPSVSKVNLKKLYPMGQCTQWCNHHHQDRDQKIIGCRRTNFLKHDALLLHWHSFAISIYWHPEHCNMPFLALSIELVLQ